MAKINSLKIQWFHTSECMGAVKGSTKNLFMLVKRSGFWWSSIDIRLNSIHIMGQNQGIR